MGLIHEGGGGGGMGFCGHGSGGGVIREAMLRFSKGEGAYRTVI